MTASTTTYIANEIVHHGDKIVDFRGDVFTFDYTENGRIFTVERPHVAFVSRVFKDKVEHLPTKETS